MNFAAHQSLWEDIPKQVSGTSEMLRVRAGSSSDQCCIHTYDSYDTTTTTVRDSLPTLPLSLPLKPAPSSSHRLPSCPCSLSGSPWGECSGFAAYWVVNGTGCGRACRGKLKSLQLLLKALSPRSNYISNQRWMGFSTNH